MANIIPEEMRKSMQSRLRARFVLAASIVALICAGFSFLALLPSYFVLTTDTSGAGSGAAISAAQNAQDRSAISNAAALLSEVTPLSSASSTASDAIAAALSLRPSGVRVDQITYTAGSPSSLMLVGSADTTGGISAYRAALAADPAFASVSVPVGALVGTEGGRFSVTLSGTF